MTIHDAVTSGAVVPRKAMLELVRQLDEVRGQRDVLAQAIRDIWSAMGGDEDDDETFARIDAILVSGGVREACQNYEN